MNKISDNTTYQVENRQIIHFVGAGPGDSELITVKGRRLLREADVVIYTGSLVPEQLLEGLKAEIHNSASLNLEQVFEIMLQSWLQGKRIVRLHTGDPALYSAIKEQIDLLNAHNIPFAVIPGVSSGTAAAAALCTELTLPEVSQTVIFTRRGGRTPVPEKEHLATLASHQASMIIFLSIGMIENVVAELLSGGYPPSTPVAIVEKVSWPDERRLRGTLATIVDQVKAAKINKTAIIAVGEVLAEKPQKILSNLYDKEFSHSYRKCGTDI